MKESDVLTRLGLKDKDELVFLLENSGRSKRMSKLASVDKEVHSVKLEFDEAGCYFKIEPDHSRNVSNNSNYFRRGWSCVLKASRKTGKEVSNKHINPENHPKEIGYQHFDSGHILGLAFHKFIDGYSCLTPDFKENGVWNDEVINDKVKNLITQFASANHQTGGSPRDSQAYFEDEVYKFLSGGKGEIFYEVKAIYKKTDGKKDRYPIGTEIYYTTLKPNENNLFIEKHVLVPNIDFDFDLSVMDGYEGYNSYREFYKNGYDEKYRKCFKDSNDSTEPLDKKHHFALVLQEKMLGIYKTSNQAKNEIGNEPISEINFSSIIDKEEYSKTFTAEEEQGIILFTKEEIGTLERFLKGSKYTESTKKNKYFRPFVRGEKIYLKYYGDDGIASVTHGHPSGDAKGYNSLTEAMKAMGWL
ncbi:hypothetical protein STRDD11_02381 [Streptococcus sp. DD11]|uniref:hypothetical protein n=1 Tax=Streptococcus sp. DD11 TaxID=1777879 RepID=UPI00079781F1|nr:hypothetical protein [Streptococcus sp. DD11]KXT78822.1 hypothetical protein STRDD11_02381 [Streptococcus sp. DD11]